MTRLLLTGQRGFPDRRFIYETLDAQHATDPITLLIHGAEPTGADGIADDWAEASGIPRAPHPFIKKLGRAGGPVRNREMLVQEHPDLVMAFYHDPDNSRGTRDMVRQARKAGVPVREFVRA